MQIHITAKVSDHVVLSCFGESQRTGTRRYSMYYDDQ